MGGIGGYRRNPKRGIEAFIDAAAAFERTLPDHPLPPIRNDFLPLATPLSDDETDILARLAVSLSKNPEAGIQTFMTHAFWATVRPHLPCAPDTLGSY